MPIKNLRPRLPEIGRLRLGQKVPVLDKAGRQKTDRNGNPLWRPERGSTWRVTTTDEELLQYVAGLYGGEVKPWEGAPGDQPQWELFTDSAVLRVIIPPGKLRLSQWMEAWQRNLCVRRCDTESMYPSGDTCACAQEADHPKDWACKPVTRLSVVLDEIPTTRVWRAELHGIHGAQELAGAAELLEAAGAAGHIVPATLAIEQRTIPARPNQPARHIVLCVLEPDRRWLRQAMIDGGHSTTAAIDAPTRELEPPEQEEPGGGPVTPPTPGPPPANTTPTHEQIRRLRSVNDARALADRAPEHFKHALLNQFNHEDEWRAFWKDAPLASWKDHLRDALTTLDQTSAAGTVVPPAAPAAGHTPAGPDPDGEAGNGPAGQPTLGGDANAD